jgi:polysaccharide biosynthesis/export protein
VTKGEFTIPIPGHRFRITENRPPTANKQDTDHQGHGKLAWWWVAAAQTRSMPPPSQLKIHLVDDDIFSAALYGRHIKDLGYEQVTLFRDGVQCLAWLDKAPDVIFLDHHMEPWNGIEVLKRIKRNSPHVHVVLLSGQQDVKTAVDALKYGAFDYVIKGAGDVERITAVLQKIHQFRAAITRKKFSLTEWIARILFGQLPWVLSKDRLMLMMLAVTTLLSSCQVQPLLQSTSPRDAVALLRHGPPPAHRIRPDDKISVSVWNHDELSVGSVFTIFNTHESFGKWLLVDGQGVVTLPGIGEIKLGGRTCQQAEEELQRAYAKTLVDPVVVVKVLNRQITLLGEVRMPGTYVIEKERVTLAEALGMAQGMTDFADRRKVELIRDGIPYLIDMTVFDDTQVNDLPIGSGDLIVIQSRNYKALAQRAPMIIPFASAITAIALILSVSGK